MDGHYHDPVIAAAQPKYMQSSTLELLVKCNIHFSQICTYTVQLYCMKIVSALLLQSTTNKNTGIARNRHPIQQVVYSLLHATKLHCIIIGGGQRYRGGGGILSSTLTKVILDSHMCGRQSQEIMWSNHTYFADPPVLQTQIKVCLAHM